MKFFDRKRKYVYFSSMDSQVKTANHYDVFTFNSEALEHNAECIGTFYSKNYAQLFTMLPAVIDELYESRSVFRDIAVYTKNQSAAFQAGNIDKLLEILSRIVSGVNNE
ncbi:MAG: hypothetical protein IJS99_01460 [Synergistaceae bacterium]|nr:hypothetical protein [Synergistaceae bacterium]